MTTPYGAPIPSPLPEAPLSLTFRVPEIPGAPQLTVRGCNGTELAGLSEDVARNAVQVGRALTEFRAGVLAGSGIQDAAAAPSAPQPSAQAPAQQYPPQTQQWGSQPGYQASQPQQQGYQAPQTGATGPAPTCPHGARIYRSGVSKSTGRPYQMWACPAPQGSGQCKPEYVN